MLDAVQNLRRNLAAFGVATVAYALGVAVVAASLAAFLEPMSLHMRAPPMREVARTQQVNP